MMLAAQLSVSLNSHLGAEVLPSPFSGYFPLEHRNLQSPVIRDWDLAGFEEVPAHPPSFPPVQALQSHARYSVLRKGGLGRPCLW